MLGTVLLTFRYLHMHVYCVVMIVIGMKKLIYVFVNRGKLLLYWQVCGTLMVKMCICYLLWRKRNMAF